MQKRRQKVVAVVWGTEFIKLLATLSILHQDDLKNRMNSLYHSSAIHPFLHIILEPFVLFFIFSKCNSSSSSYHTRASHPFLHIIQMQFILFLLIILVQFILFFIYPSGDGKGLPQDYLKWSEVHACSTLTPFRS